MTFSAELRSATAAEREHLLSAPVIADCLAGRVGRDSYRGFLTEAYHHVKHTVPLLMACGARLPERLEWLRRGSIEAGLREICQNPLLVPVLFVDVLGDAAAQPRRVLR